MSDTPHPSPFKSKRGLGRLFNALRYAVQGMQAALTHEASFRQEFGLAVIMIPAAFWLGRHPYEVLLLIAVVLVVLVVELLNSAIETVADAVSLEPHPLIGRAKDLGSAAVMITLIFAGATWAMVAYLRFWG